MLCALYGVTIKKVNDVVDRLVIQYAKTYDDPVRGPAMPVGRSKCHCQKIFEDCLLDYVWNRSKVKDPKKLVVGKPDNISTEVYHTYLLHRALTGFKTLSYAQETLFVRLSL